MSEWNQEQAEYQARSDFAIHQSNYARVDLVVAARKRAFDAEHKAQQLQSELAALKAAHAWIKTSERMPEATRDVLGVVKGALMLLRYAPDEDQDRPWLDENIGCYPTSYVSHWQPLPEAPK